jgi:hypothetical protein
MNEEEFYRIYLELYSEVNPKNIEKLRKLGNKHPDLELRYLKYISFRNSLEDYLPKSFLIPEQKILLIGGETDAETLAIHETIPESTIYALNSNWKRFDQMSSQLATKIDGRIGENSIIDGEHFDLILIYQMDHTISYVDKTNQKKEFYSHINKLLKENNICFASYYYENELDEALEELTDNKIIYAGENKRSRPINFRGHFPRDLGFSPSDTYILVFQK